MVCAENPSVHLLEIQYPEINHINNRQTLNLFGGICKQISEKLLPKTLKLLFIFYLVVRRQMPKIEFFSAPALQIRASHLWF